jgi:hypothetical protein
VCFQKCNTVNSRKISCFFNPVVKELWRIKSKTLARRLCGFECKTNCCKSIITSQTCFGQLFRRYKNSFPTNYGNFIRNEWLKYVQIHVIHTHLTRFLAEIEPKITQNMRLLEWFYDIFSDYYNCLTFCIENFRSFRYGLCLCLKKVHILDVLLA